MEDARSSSQPDGLWAHGAHSEATRDRTSTLFLDDATHEATRASYIAIINMDVAPPHVGFRCRMTLKMVAHFWP